MQGLGVMIQMLSGNAESVAAFTGALGKTIATAELKDDALRLTFVEGGGIQFSDEGQSCCEHRYMQTDDELSSFVGSKLVGAEIKEAPNAEDEYGEHEIEFLEIQTSTGVFTMASHNEHNGYYGGFCIRVSALATTGEQA